MEEFGDWLYLIIIIIAGISSLIGTINKKNKEAAERKQPREIITENYSQPRKTRDNDYSIFKKDIEHAAPVALYTEEEYDDDDNTSITVEDLPANTDEWRKAFVYNEIFNRKY
ncbi:MAG: hypothetical protein LBG28_08395 [Tannerella sp.]|jgi:hypothetical protein|nr:hypothetical protein [Tannerella sp.]